MDYTAVKTPEIRFTRHNTQIRDSDSIDVMILTDDNDDELEETFYLNFNPMRNALFIPPRIPITICGSKHKFYLNYTSKIHIAYVYCMLPDRFNCSSIYSCIKTVDYYMFTLSGFVKHTLGNGEVDWEVFNLRSEPLK